MLIPGASNGRFGFDGSCPHRMASLVKSAALQNAGCCTCEEMLRQQTPERATAAESASYQFEQCAANDLFNRCSFCVPNNLDLCTFGAVGPDSALYDP